MLVPFKEIIQDAYNRKYAVGAFNCLSVENVIGAINAAEELKSPIILQLAEVQFPSAPLELMGYVFLEAAKRAGIPVAVHLDHGQSVETCIRAIQCGFKSVMFDGANLPFHQNAETSRLVSSLAHSCGVDIEAELGKVGDAQSSQNEDIFTDVAEAVRFIEETNVDALAIAIGNLHGKYIATPKLNINRLKELSAAVSKPLVLHGGSGTSESDFKESIRNGISKINVATAIQLEITDAMEKYMSEHAFHNYAAIKKIMIEASARSISEHILLFESDGKA